MPLDVQVLGIPGTCSSADHSREPPSPPAARGFHIQLAARVRRGREGACVGREQWGPHAAGTRLLTSRAPPADCACKQDSTGAQERTRIQAQCLEGHSLQVGAIHRCAWEPREPSIGPRLKGCSWATPGWNTKRYIPRRCHCHPLTQPALGNLSLTLTHAKHHLTHAKHHLSLSFSLPLSLSPSPSLAPPSPAGQTTQNALLSCDPSGGRRRGTLHSMPPRLHRQAPAHPKVAFPLHRPRLTALPSAP